MDESVKKNMQLLLELMIICLCISLIIGGITYIFFKDGYFIEWLTLIVSLIGVLISGILTMCGVILTINRAISNEKKKEERIIRNSALIVHSEIKEFLNSVKDFNLNMIEVKFFMECLGEDNFEETAKKNVWINDIYFMSSNIKELFYNILSKNYNSDVMYYFRRVYGNHERLRKFYDTINDINSIRSTNVLDNITSNCLDKEFITFRIEVLSYVGEEFWMKNDRYHETVEEYKKRLIDYKEKNVFCDDANRLLEYLESVYSKQ